MKGKQRRWEEREDESKTCLRSEADDVSRYRGKDKSERWGEEKKCARERRE
jgi:hypothetical protein